MKPRTKLAQKSLYASRLFLLDTCFLIGALNPKGIDEKALLKRLLESGASLIISSSILRETRRVLHELWGQPAEAELREILTRVRIFDDRRYEIISEAQSILIHPPDNNHIATAKYLGASIISCDVWLINVARAIKLDAFSPSEMLDKEEM